jgi:hypothetical protein
MAVACPVLWKPSKCSHKGDFEHFFAGVTDKVPNHTSVPVLAFWPLLSYPCHCSNRSNMQPIASVTVPIEFSVWHLWLDISSCPPRCHRWASLHQAIWALVSEHFSPSDLNSLFVVEATDDPDRRDARKPWR